MIDPPRAIGIRTTAKANHIICYALNNILFISYELVLYLYDLIKTKVHGIINFLKYM